MVKTLIMENEKGEPLVVLMHGDRKVSTKELARAGGHEAHRALQARGRARAIPDISSAARRPSARARSMPIFLERSVLDLPRIYINGGRRGYLLGMDPAELMRVLSPMLVDVAIEE